MRLFIAEKPSVGKAIAACLGQTASGDGFIQCGPDNKVTWCFGHMLEQAEPDEYTPDDVPRVGAAGKKLWRVDELPIIPEAWILKPKDDAKKQLATIGKLLKEAAEVVHAGDPDREGQLLVDEVLELYNFSKPVRRFWVSSQDTETIRRGLAALKDNAAYRGWSDAARGRQRADWLIGMNLSRAFTLRAQRGGSRALLTVGRVQTPTLAVVVQRDREIEAHRPIPYHTVRAMFAHEGVEFRADWRAREEQAGLDSEGRLVDTAIADGIVAATKGRQGAVTLYDQAAKKKNHPLAFSLSGMTSEASARFGYSAADVLEACQALYEAKLTSYPRTDSSHLPEAQHADAARVLAAIVHVNPELANIVAGADPAFKSKTWDDAKVTAHHGIIPTMERGSKAGLKEKERNVYDLIVRAYIAQFYPVHEFMKTTIEIQVNDQDFVATGKVVTRNGWKDVYDTAADKEEGAGAESEEGDQPLPALQKGAAVQCTAAERRDAKTKAPPRFTAGTLDNAMENIHRFVADPEHKKMLREGDGIGTAATRPSTVAELHRRGFLEAKGKAIISTTLGRSLVDALPEAVKSPVLTAINERMLKAIEQGSAQLDAFVAKQETFIRGQVMKANDGAVTIAGGKEGPAVSAVHKCMACSAGLVRNPSKRQKGSFWWGCSKYPTCEMTYPDVKGRPDYSKGRAGSTSTAKE